MPSEYPYFGPGVDGLIELLRNKARVLVEYDDTGSIDAFARTRVSEPFTLFDSQNEYNANPLFWETSITGAGTAAHIYNEAAIRMTVGTATGDRVTRQSKRYIRYQPGKSQMILMTGVIGEAKENVAQRIGYFDDNNGIFVQQAGEGLSIVRRTSTSGSAVNNAIAQADWNIDTLDGNGKSGVAVDPTKTQIVIIDLEWLGVGRVRVGFVVDGVPIYCHQFLNANNLTTVYMRTANLPLRYEIENTGDTASASTMTQICSSVSSEGGVQERNVTFSASNDTTLRTVSTTPLPVLSIRCGTAFPAGGTIENRETVVPLNYDIYSEDAPIHYKLVYNGTVGGASWVAANATHSGVEYDVSGTAITGGIVIDAGYIGSTNQAKSSELKQVDTDLFLTLNIAGTVGDTLSVVCVRTATTNSDTGVSITWKELY